MRWAALLLALTPVAATGQSSTETPPATPAPAPPETATGELTAENTAAIMSALERGQLLFRYDQAAWHSTDRLRTDVPEARLRTVRGWVVVPAEGRALRVIYYDGNTAPHRAVWSATWTSGTSVTDTHLHDESDNALDAEATRLIALRDALSLSDFRFCARERPNIVILPASATGSTDSVYLLTPQTNAGVPFGGHHRIDFAGGREVARRSFTNGCVTIPMNGNGTALAITHLLDPVPTEIHVFTVFAARRPVYVGVTEPQRIFVVEVSGGVPRIRILPPSAD